MKILNRLPFLAFLMVCLLVVSETQAQRRMYGYRSYGRSYAYRTRPSVSIGFGSFYPGRWYGHGVWPGGGFSIGLNLPPVGYRINTLPYGAARFYFGGIPYYFYGDAYYRTMDNGGYEVVDAPLGAMVHRLPGQVQRIRIDGQVYYEANGTYFMASQDENGNRAYMVVGSNGKLDTNEAMRINRETGIDRYNNNRPDNNEGDEMYPEDTDQRNTPDEMRPSQKADNTEADVNKPQLGDRFDMVPRDSRTVTVNGQKQYVSPAGTYYKEVIADGKTVYEVVKVR